jgi:hypothetical protein
MPQNIPEWAQPQEYKEKDNGKGPSFCEQHPPECNVPCENPGNGSNQHCADEVPVDGGLFFLFVAGLVFAISKLKQ